MNRLLILLLCCFCFSCKKNTGGNEPILKAPNTTTALKPITTDVAMVFINGGSYKPFFGLDTILVEVTPFLLDERPVTNAEFLRFVKANPQWRRSNVIRLYADTSYLYDWESDTTLPPNRLPNAPICYVTWFAAKAYAESVSKRLPTLDEWEFVAMANEKMPNAREEKTYSDAIIDLYLIKDRQYNPVKQSAPNYYGVYNIFDLIWEWTDDFNSVLTTGDSREVNTDNKGLFCGGGAASATDALNYAAFMRFGFRASLKANYSVSNLGFRCAKDTTIAQ